VAPPRVAGSPVHFECRHLNTLRLPGNGPMGAVDVVFGLVVAVHIDDALIGADGRLDVVRMRPIARMGYYEYTTVDSVFEMVIPGDQRALLAGLEGSATKAGAALASVSRQG
jgi:flavin reductase (DIM6/NTAB) family NADH-FMN oxidoreductase RutF